MRLQSFAPIRGRKVRFALAGCGRIWRNHLESLKTYSHEAEIVGVCDVDAGALEAAKAATAAPGYGSYEELLARTNADVVVLATPSGLHAEQTIRAAAAGKHVITEKPMATRWLDGKRMVSACDQAGVRLFVVKQNRHNATLQLLKQAVDRGRFGRIYMAAVNVFWSRPQSYYDSAAWRGTWEFDGGAFMNQASHYVDLLDWMIGPVESVQAYTATLARDIEVEDTGVMAMRWRSGALGTMSVTMLVYPKNFEASISVFGERGSVRIGGLAVNQIQHWEFAEPDPQDDEVKESSYQTTSVYGFGHLRYYDNVLKTLRGEAEAQTDGREGLRSLELLVATYLSARDGRRVTLPLDY